MEKTPIARRLLFTCSAKTWSWNGFWGIQMVLWLWQTWKYWSQTSIDNQIRQIEEIASSGRVRIPLYRGAKCSTFWTFGCTNFGLCSSFYNVKSYTNLSLMMNEQKIAIQNFQANSHPVIRSLRKPQEPGLKLKIQLLAEFCHPSCDINSLIPVKTWNACLSNQRLKGT